MKLYDERLNGRGDHADLDPTIGRGPASGRTYDGSYDDSASFHQIDLLRVVRRRAWAIVLVMFASVALATGLTLMQTPLYTTSIKILVEARSNSDYATAPANVTGLESLTATLTELVTTGPVAQDAIERLESPTTSVDSLLGALSAQQVEGTQLIEVSYTNSSPREAQRIVNAVGAAFSQQVNEKNLGGTAGVANVQETAALPTSPVSPNPLRNVALALAAGLMLGVGLAMLLEVLDDDWRSPDEVERISGVPTLGIVPSFKAHKGKRKGLLQ